MNGPQKAQYEAAAHYPAPAPADYSDEVTPEDLESLKEAVRSEMDSEEWIAISEPAW